MKTTHGANVECLTGVGVGAGNVCAQHREREREKERARAERRRERRTSEKENCGEEHKTELTTKNQANPTKSGMAERPRRWKPRPNSRGTTVFSHFLLSVISIKCTVVRTGLTLSERKSPDFWFPCFWAETPWGHPSDGRFGGKGFGKPSGDVHQGEST